jgi:hypothetical protein
LELLLAQLVREQAVTAFATIVTTPITEQGLSPALKDAQADVDLFAGTDQACTRDMGVADQLDRIAPVCGTGQPSTPSDQKAYHFFRSTSKAAISFMVFSLRWSSLLRALISRWSLAQSLSCSFCSHGSASSPDCVYKVSTGFSLASWAT